MQSPRFLLDIQSQPSSLRRVFDHQIGKGKHALLEAAQILRAGRRVILTGMGASMYAAIPLEYFLSANGIDAIAIESAELLHYRLRSCRDAVVVLASRSGDSIEITKLLDRLQVQTVTIGITNEADSTLARRADCSITVNSLADEMVAIQSYTGTLLALLLLGSAATNKLESTCSAVELALQTLPGLINHGLETIAEWDGFLDPKATVYLLGRGPSWGSVLEGVLLFHETAKAAAVGMPAASFRHGPVECVDEGFRSLIFAPEGPTRDLNLCLARDLVRFGGRVRMIGPEREGTEFPHWCRTPDVPEVLAPLAQIIPVQFAALRLAQLKGLAVGRFRYTPHVTRDESSFAPTI